MESYKPLIAIPVIITIIALAIITFNGINENIDLKGGTVTTLNLETPLEQFQLESIIKEGLNITEVTINSFNGKTATITMGTSADVVTFTDIMNGKATITSYSSITPLLSAQAIKQVYWAVVIAFIFMSITVFIVFRNFVPSMAVIFAALADIIIALGGMSLFGIPLSLASVGALLLLIGYSVDTDILLTTRVLKHTSGTVTQRARDAMKTGFTMAAAAISAMLSLLIITTYFIPSAEILANIAAVLIIGLMADVLATWLMNLGILRWYLESGHK